MMKRLHIGVSDNMHKCVKLFATYNDITVNELINRSIVMYLNNQTEFSNSPLLEQELKNIDIPEETTEYT